MLACCIGDPVDPELTPAQGRALARLVAASPPELLIGHEASFGGTALSPDVELVGYLLSPRRLDFAAGSTFELTLVWRVHDAPPGGFRLFTHLVDERGRILKNLDRGGALRREAGSGAPLPPSTWPRDAYVLDPLSVPLPKDAPARVRLLVGFYRGRARLVAHGDGADPRLGAAVLTFSAKGGGVARDAVPTLEVPRLRAGSTILLDGVLDEDAWKKAARTDAFVSPSTGAIAEGSPVQGSARLFYDERSLYVAFEVADRDVTGGFDERARDPHLWTRDTVEVMIDPDGDGDNRDYYEIQIGPQNLVFDSRFDDYNSPRGGPDGPFGHQHWSSNVRSAVLVAGTIDDPSDVDGGYVVEARLPFSAFEAATHTPPRVGDRWRVNLYAMQDNGGVAWSPILGEGNFHKASRFGRVIWSDATIP